MNEKENELNYYNYNTESFNKGYLTTTTDNTLPVFSNGNSISVGYYNTQFTDHGKKVVMLEDEDYDILMEVLNKAKYDKTIVGKLEKLGFNAEDETD